MLRVCCTIRIFLKYRYFDIFLILFLHKESRMMTMFLGVKSIFAFLFLSLSFNALGKESAAWIAENSEIVYFFSLECGACYKHEPYVSLLKLKTAKHASLYKIPLSTSTAKVAGKRLYFLLMLSQRNYNLTPLEVSRAAYSLLLDNPNTKVDDANEYKALLKKYGMQFSDFEFNKWWASSSVLINDSLQLENKANEEKGSVAPGDIRVVVEDKVYWFFLSEDKPLVIIKEIMELISDES